MLIKAVFIFLLLSGFVAWFYTVVQFLQMCRHWWRSESAPRGALAKFAAFSMTWHSADLPERARRHRRRAMRGMLAFFACILAGVALMGTAAMLAPAG